MGADKERRQGSRAAKGWKTKGQMRDSGYQAKKLEFCPAEAFTARY